MIARYRGPRPPRRALVFLPNGFTLFNLFCGIHSIVWSSRGNFGSAAAWVVVGGIADALDGRVARATGTGSRMGEELDSLVDGISFGLAPALMMYFAVLNRGNWEWLFAFYFVMCAVLRLARFNVEQAGRSKTHFHGLPSPAAGMTLVTYYWFSQTQFYNQTAILLTDSATLADWPWHAIMRVLMVVLASLMISNVPYPAVPVIGYRSVRQVVGTLIVLGGALALILRPRELLFPALLAYVLFGALKWVTLGLAGRRGEPDEIFFEPDPDDLPAAAPAIPGINRRATPGVAPRSIPATTLSQDEADDEQMRVRRKRRRRRKNDGRRRDGASRPDGPPIPPPPHEDSSS